MLAASLYYTLFDLRSTVSLWQMLLALPALPYATQIEAERIEMVHVDTSLPDLPPPLEGLAIIPQDDVRLLLVHNPDFTEMLPDGRVDLALCGHTHGGYVRLPLLGAPLSPSCFGRKFIAGLAQSSHTQVYVNRGLGGIKLRFLARPEITVLHLTLRASDLSPPSSGSIIWQDGTRAAALSPDHRATPH